MKGKFPESGNETVSPDAYRIAQALYSSCLAKSEARLEAVEAAFNDSSEQPLEITEKEQRWLKAIITDAKAGNWQSAAADARQMMEASGPALTPSPAGSSLNSQDPLEVPSPIKAA